MLVSHVESFGECGLLLLDHRLDRQSHREPNNESSTFHSQTPQVCCSHLELASLSSKSGKVYLQFTVTFLECDQTKNQTH